ncbi:hypothetical protein G4B84_006774 [Aspergillus flavus NRRL3357]|nr:uncharacterized protein G4B84_006774 [Aspergillus flavus NRRL3357]QMW31393.1 hypothetical protein G4B84_006774 [Aspergillus flavus NRRL3357]QMW43437.1 hypothetical protein G4B11_006807 [Aspergillus flavus]
MSFQTRGRGCFNCGDASHQVITPQITSAKGIGHVFSKYTIHQPIILRTWTYRPVTVPRRAPQLVLSNTLKMDCRTGTC